MPSSMRMLNRVVAGMVTQVFGANVGVSEIRKLETLLDDPGSDRRSRDIIGIDDVDGLLWEEIELSDQLLTLKRRKPRV
ncbi:hypothetical protein LOK49_LG01G03097 [Camellia lanceoleosa]|uniref:Uncharacterized protein n=1 Tax=Camellia lanceoleosa TaxID=1840588 RepID=A0ACC0IZ90_9ERIC|nr:hypothetical protein LOK49_LG01G03097 [Camellia lanceoleosa]